MTERTGDILLAVAAVAVLVLVFFSLVSAPLF